MDVYNANKQYIFPFTTCEKPTAGFIAQPVSTAINLLTCIGLLVLLFTSTGQIHVSVVSLIISLFAFEMWHAFSHMRHIEGRLQSHVIHALTYLITLTTLLVIHATTGSVHLSLVAVAVAIDIAVLMSGDKNAALSVVSGVIVFVTAILGNIEVFPPEYMQILVTLIILGVSAFILEYYFCHVAMNVAVLPYHALVEIITMAFILIFAQMMLEHEAFFRKPV